ncbi:two-component system activity regulator YycH [Sulfoacidibacillus thermotolerans]|uniref:Regulatory protein YycH domain-containing protein n=1 Tax=Sulfoacidibacillus thermotolerans TaxID=1765684 RepID=A0A2U3D9G5_SULT2|nr:two-component system activity regulator YycH [Sulfoacidibacillus thermotolerans]PWI57929.1 hypothetical protein BM613_05820 [Sulfoacidibacillus thermotolerans]
MRILAKNVLESAKTILLILLVLCSIVLSGIVWTGTPTEMTVGRSHFFSSPLYGRERLVSDFVKPQAIWVWTKDNELFRLSGESATAQGIFQSLQGAHMRYAHLITNKRFTVPPMGPYIALDFGHLLADGSLWSYAFPTLHTNENWSVQGWVYLVPEVSSEDWSVYFQTSQGIDHLLLSGVANTLRSALIPNDQYVPYAQLAYDHKLFNLPYDALSMRSQTWILEDPSPMPIVNSFFRDPSLIQTVQVNRGMTVYTDGMHVVQLSRELLGFKLNYCAPQVPLAHYGETMENALTTAVPFLDSHGGFVGNEVLERVSSGKKLDPVALSFRDEVEGWPLYSQLNQIQVQLINGSVSHVTRLLSYLQSEVAQQRVTILSGSQLLQILQTMHLHQIHSITLGYGTELQTLNEVQVVPVYQIKMSRHTLYLNAQTGQPFQGMGM